MRPKYYANQIFRGKNLLSLEGQSEDFKLYASSEREPMKFIKHKVRDARLSGKAGYQSSSCVEHVRMLFLFYLFRIEGPFRLACCLFLPSLHFSPSVLSFFPYRFPYMSSLLLGYSSSFDALPCCCMCKESNIAIYLQSL